MDKEVALEALGVLCNAEVTSVQGQGADTSGGSAHSSHPPLTLHHLFTILDEDEFRAVRDQAGGGRSRIPASTRAVKKFVVAEDDLFDPIFDLDFTNVTDTETYSRGGEKYERPCGWTRFGLKVLGKYGDDTWLGNNQRTTESVAGEWPVSYHGTSREGAEGIIEGNYQAGDGNVYGRGIYSTPYILEATPYTRKFKSEKTGKQYKVLLQNRINPKYREICDYDKYWLVKIPKRTSDDKEKEIVNGAIRPYGLLLKEI